MQSEKRGRIELILGPMFSGKSTELLRRLRRHELASKKVVLVKHMADDRYSPDSKGVLTHDLIGKTASLVTSDLTRDLLPQFGDADVIGIDEGQFFTDVPEVAEALSARGKLVIVAGLSGTFER